MCGIGGALHVDVRRGEDLPLAGRALRERLAHRGPDGEGAYVGDGAWLVHTRLALVDIAGGAQPLQTPDGRFTLVVNGEIYGHRARREALLARGAVFRTTSDAEVLLWAIALDGPEAVAHLEGEYAFCVWDSVARRAWLGRDLLGVKPLVLARRGRSLWFASEAQALRAALPGLEVDVDAVARAFACPPLSGSDALPYRGVESAPAGVVLEVSDGDVRVVVDRRRRRKSAAADLDGALVAALRAAVSDRIDADVEVGAFLSGGVDSTAMVAAALDDPRAPRPLRCTSIAYAGPRRAGSIVVGDDAEHVRGLAARWPLALTTIGSVDDAERLRVLEAVWASQDRIAAWEQELSQRRLAEAAVKSIKAVLVGDAADETHAGYTFLLETPTCLHPAAFVARFGGALRRAMLRPERRGAVDDIIDDALAVASAHDAPFGGSDVNAARRATTAVIQGRWLPRLLHNGDLHTMAVSLEARVPFADERVVAVADAIDVNDAYAEEDDDDPVPEKRVLRRALRGLVPASILARRKSALPRDEDAGPHFQRLLRERLDGSGRERLATIVDIDAARALLDRDPHDDVVRAALFSTLSVEAFLRHHG